MSSDESYGEPPDELDEMLAGAFGEDLPEPVVDKFADLAHEILNMHGSDARKKAKIQIALEAMDLPELEFHPPANWDEWLELNKNDAYDWIIPDLIERGERTVVVAGEGAGKTTLMRQMAITAAAGIHPFTGNEIEKVTTLTIDCENMPKIVQRKSRRIMNIAKERSFGEVKAYLELLPSGINLMKAGDRRFVERMIEEIRPDILFMGPLYKTFIDPGGRSSESIATEIAMFYDYLRTEYGCALVLEQHAPLGNSINGRDLRPFGSAVWSRWPEFGITLTKDPTDPSLYKFGDFRGRRDERDWPETARKGTVNDFPFVVI